MYIILGFSYNDVMNIFTFNSQEKMSKNFFQSIVSFIRQLSSRIVTRRIKRQSFLLDHTLFMEKYGFSFYYYYFDDKNTSNTKPRNHIASINEWKIGETIFWVVWCSDSAAQLRSKNNVILSLQLNQVYSRGGKDSWSLI